MKKIEVLKALKVGFEYTLFLRFGTGTDERTAEIKKEIGTHYVEKIGSVVADLIGIIEAGKMPIVKIHDKLVDAIIDANVFYVPVSKETKKDIAPYVNTWIIGSLERALREVEPEYREIKGTNNWTVYAQTPTEVVYEGNSKKEALKIAKESVEKNKGTGYWVDRNGES